MSDPTDPPSEPGSSPDTDADAELLAAADELLEAQADDEPLPDYEPAWDDAAASAAADAAEDEAAPDPVAAARPPAVPTVASLRVPPHSMEAEQSVLGALMLAGGSDVWFDVAELITPADFYRTQHQAIFQAMCDLSNAEQPLDLVTVSGQLESAGKLARAGGQAYLIELSEATPGTANLVAYARIVQERAVMRQLIAAANRISESAFAPNGRTSADLIDLAERSVFDISEGRTGEGGPEAITPLLSRAVTRLEQLFTQKSAITGLPTGFDDLDRRTAGLQPSDMIVVAARPSMGKTAFAVNMAEHAIMEKEGAVLIFSMEMPSEQIVMRLLSSLGRIDQTRMRTGDLEDRDWSSFTSAVSLLKGKKLYIDDTPALTPTDVRTRARRVARESGGLSMIIVDYLQLMRVPERAENRVNEISEISRSLKALAKEMRCPLLALSQLNRSLESRPDKRPQMSDLRESGAIEQDADVILFIYRDEVYHEDSPDKGIAEIIIGKQRNGPIGRVKLSFIGKLTKFENLAPDVYNDYA